MQTAVTRLYEEADKAGRNPQDITISFRAPLFFSDVGGTARQLLSGSVSAIQDDIGCYAACGVSHMIFDVVTLDVADMWRVMERFAQDVMPGVRT